MKLEQVLPICSIVLSVGAAIIYFWRGDIRHGIYWTSAAILTGSVTF